MVRNQAFHDQDDIYSVLDRQLRLWREYDPRVTSILDGKTPGELLEAATGLSVRTFWRSGWLCTLIFLAGSPVSQPDSSMISTPICPIRLRNIPTVGGGDDR